MKQIVMDLSRDCDDCFIKDKQERIVTIVDLIASNFCEAVSGDLFPNQELDQIFGIEPPTGLGSVSLQDMPLGHLVFSVWLDLIRYAQVTKEDIAHELLRGDLPQFFERSVIGLSKEHPEFNYPKTLIKRGFNHIKWDVEFHKAVQKIYSAPIKQKQDAPKDDPSSKQKVQQDNSPYRKTIDQGLIHVAYGLDRANGFFLSVGDKRLEWCESASEEVNEVCEEVGVKDGGGSYFDLHTGEFGLGTKVSVQTMVEFWKRYGVSEDHISVMMNSSYDPKKVKFAPQIEKVLNSLAPKKVQKPVNISKMVSFIDNFESGTYTGQVNDKDTPDGRGIWESNLNKFGHKQIYEGNYVNGWRHGLNEKLKIIYADKTELIYEGEFKNGMWEGKGRMQYKNGFILDGTFERIGNKQNMRGTIIKPNGRRYQSCEFTGITWGKKAHPKMTGQCILRDNGFVFYKGSFIDLKPIGNGVCFNNDLFNEYNQ